MLYFFKLHEVHLASYEILFWTGTQSRKHAIIYPLWSMSELS